MALQNNYKAVIDYTQYSENGPKRCDRYNVQNCVVIGRARDCSETIQRIQEKFAPGSSDKCTVKSIEYLGWETF